jgi:probable rRNA maturation factor
MGILIDNQQNSRRINLEVIQKTAQAILNDLDCPEGELSILLVDDQRIQDLNREYRHKDTPTNVLSFSMREGDFADVSPDLLGDVVISMDTAAAEAEKAGISLGRHMTWLLIHGILHLFGFDHEQSQPAADEMESRTAILMEKVKTLISTDLQ